jgi:signal transduction histidine kinase
MILFSITGLYLYTRQEKAMMILLKLYKAVCCLLFIVILSSGFVFSQQAKNERASVNDSVQITKLANQADLLASTQPDSAIIYYKKADSLCQAAANEKLFLNFYSLYSWVLNNQNRFDESLKLGQRALAISQKLNSNLDIAHAYSSIGLVYVNMSYYQLALENYFKAMDLYQALNESKAICRLYSRISGCYYPLKLYKKSLEYEEKQFDCALASKDTTRILSFYFNAGLCLKEMGDFEKAFSYYQQATELNKVQKDKIMDCRLKYALAAVMNALGNYQRAIQYAEEGISISKTMNFESGVAINMAEMGRAYMKLGKFREARDLLKQSVDLALKNNLGEELQLALDPIRFVEAALGNFSASEEYDKLFRKLSDSIFNLQSSNSLQELESKYQAEKKEIEINRLQSEKKVQDLSLQKKNIINIILVGSALIILIISLLTYRNYRQKQKLQQQRIIELETEKQLMATEAVLKGEEQERSRLAKDLHDGLGGILSGIKYAFQSMKGSLVMTPENHLSFEKGLDMLDSSMKEMRRVAHNLMPEALVKFGLDTALKDFCNDINQSGVLKIRYQSIGMENAITHQTTAITIYRVVQELINNTIRHADAKTAIVQLAKSNGKISITVEDDGKGFNPAILSQSKGIGWSNIQHRIEFLKGTMDVQSAPGEGVSVHIELTV